ncbi:G1 family glutamic endopeptidase [Kitasatospora sp. NPDC052896]|uniref:G1 family glutamic endopeptidase n=1 Tax=Kitasatospora sp. NPDC052896 TaxID=3364061 RepID=UPI0037CBA659
MPATRRSSLAIAAALLAVAANTAPALAASAPAVPNAPMIPSGSAPHLVGPHGEILHSSSSNWSGYATTGAKFTSVSASWVQPTATCDGNDSYSSFWVGLDGDGSDSVEQTGTEVDCSEGSPLYSSWYEMYPAYPVNFNDAVRPGDHFTASVTAGDGGSFTLKLSDTTQGWSHTVKKTLSNAALASAEIIAEAPSDASGPLPLTNFGTVDFTGAKVNDKPLGSFNPDNITMATNGSTLATTSPITDSKDFSVSWKRSS